MSAKQAWLAKFNWDFVESINRGFCEREKIEFKRFMTGGYYEHGKSTWQDGHANPCSLLEAVTFCAHMHQISPFNDYNGATFAIIMKQAITESDDFESESQKEIIRSAAGHVIAGTAEGDELRRLLDFDGR